MIETKLEQLKAERQTENTSRLTLEQFKTKVSKDSNKEELEKLTGGTMASCHPGSGSSNPLGDYVNGIWNAIKWP